MNYTDKYSTRKSLPEGNQHPNNVQVYLTVDTRVDNAIYLALFCK